MLNKEFNPSHFKNAKLFNIILKVIIPLAFWISVWQLAALIIDNSFLLPSVYDTFRSLVKLFLSGSFYSAVLLSAVRVIIGLVIGILSGVILASLSNRFNLIATLALPIITVIKSTPVASFIVLLWVMMSGDVLSVFIGFLMVLPIIYQSTLDGYGAIDPQLSEVSGIYEFSRMKRFRLLVFPTLRKYLVPAIITASGLCWKAEIAAEIIAYTKRSIGQGINDAKYGLDTSTVFAWTVVVIILSIILEKITKYMLRRASK